MYLMKKYVKYPNFNEIDNSSAGIINITPDVVVSLNKRNFMFEKNSK